MRQDWRAEWEGELEHRAAALSRWSPSPWRLRAELARRSAGAFWDALWLQSSQWYSLRLFSRHWRLAAAAVLSLAGALAATVVGFAAFNALLLRPPGVHDPRALQFIHVREGANAFGSVSYAEFTDYREGSRAFADIAAFPYSISTAEVTTADRRESILLTQVSTNYFPVLGIDAVLGTLAFNAATDAPDAAVIAHHLWIRLGANPHIVGTSIRINDTPLIVTGVVPDTFSGMTLVWKPDVWVPLKTAERIFSSDPRQLTDRRQRWLHLVGRLAPGVSRQQALDDVTRVSSRLALDHADTDAGRTAVLTNVTVTPPGDRGWMSVLLGGLLSLTLLALIVACANVVNLLLGLTASRRHEMLVRAALGASRAQLAGPVLRESLTLALVSGGLGFGLAVLALRTLAATSIPMGSLWPSPSLDIRPDGRVFALTLITTLAAGLAVGVPPALRAAADGLSGAITREMGSGDRRRGRARNLLVVIQMAVATIVMIGLGVSLRSAVSLERAPLGFSAPHLDYITMNLAHSGYDEQTGRQFYGRALERVAAVPGVSAVTLADNPPLAGFPREPVRDDSGVLPQSPSVDTPFATVDDSYFDAIGMKVLAGRAFDSRDRPGRPPVVMVNATLASRRWPGAPVIGQHLRVGNGRQRVEVIGVVPDSRYDDIAEAPTPFVYFPLGQRYTPAITIIARTSARNVPGAQAIVAPLFALNPRLAVTGIMTVEDIRGLYLVLPRMIALTTTVLATLTLALAILGLYSTVFYSVSQRQIEMGIRVALGAEPSDIVKAVLRGTAGVAVLGAGLGLLGGLALLPLAGSVLYGIGRVEPLVLGSVVAASLAIALTTAYGVARPWMRLTSVDLLRR